MLELRHPNLSSKDFQPFISSKLMNEVFRLILSRQSAGQTVCTPSIGLESIKWFARNKKQQEVTELAGLIAGTTGFAV